MLSLSLLVLDNTPLIVREVMILQITVIYTNLTGHCSTGH